MPADEPLLSPRRIAGAFRLWLYLLSRDCYVPLGRMLRYEWRPRTLARREGYDE